MSLINLLEKFSASKFFFFSKFENFQFFNNFDFFSKFWRTNKTPQESKSDFRRRLKKNTFPCKLGCKGYKCSYFKIYASVRILPSYEDISLKYWKKVIFQWGSIKTGIWNIQINSPLEYFAFKLYLTLHVHISGTTNDMKTLQGTRSCLKVISHLNSESFSYTLF